MVEREPFIAFSISDEDALGPSICRLCLMEVLPNGFGGFARDNSGERFGCSLLHVAQAAEVSEEALAGLRTDAWDVEEF